MPLGYGYRGELVVVRGTGTPVDETPEDGPDAEAEPEPVGTDELPLVVPPTGLLSEMELPAADEETDPPGTLVLPS